MTARGVSPSVRESRGFTLVEILIALIVFAIGALTLVAVVPLGINRNQAAALQTRASELAAQRAEQLLDIPYDDDDLLSGTHDDPANPFERTYYVRWVVEDDQPAVNCKRVTITVHRNSLARPPAARLTIVTPQSGG